MTTIPRLATALLACTVLATASHAQTLQTGMEQLTIADDTRPLGGAVWYPTGDNTAPVRALGNVVWEPIHVVPNAAPATGRHPLVLLSHGMFGNHRNQAWLAEGLVAQGYIVAAIDHPGTSTFERDPIQRKALWERPRDISRTIDHLLADDTLGPLIDPDRTFMAGHSMGGFTAVALAGGQFDLAHWQDFCATTPGDLVCGIFSAWGVGASEEDRAQLAGDTSDPRIRAFAVFDLGGTQTFSPESLGAIERPMLIYGAPVPGSDIDLDVESRALVAALPDTVATYHEPAGLAHFDFLGLCTEAGLGILLEEEPADAIVCTDARETRAAEHDRIIGEVAAFFAAN